MRWRRFAATLPADDYSAVVNRFTAGRGYLYLMARLIADNADTPTIVAQAAQASHYLIAVAQALAAAHPAAARANPVPPPAVPALTWQAFVATLAPGAAAELDAALAAALDGTRQVASIMREDGDFALVQRLLASSLEGLQRLLELCSARD